MGPNHLLTIFKILEDSGARYLIVGGVAVVLHGHPRFTADVDIVPSFSPDELTKLIDALDAHGFRPRAPVPMTDFLDPAKRKQWIEEKNMTVFSLWNPDMPAVELDLFVEAPFSFDEVYWRALVTDEEACTVRVIGLEDLISMKRAAGRYQDIMDVNALEAIRNERDAHG